MASFQALTSICGAAAAQKFTVSTPPDRTEMDSSVKLINARLGSAVDKGQEIQVLLHIRTLLHVTTAILFSQGYSLHFFLIFAHLWWFWVLGLGLILGVWGWGFQLMGFGACGVGPYGFFGFGLSI